MRESPDAIKAYNFTLTNACAYHLAARKPGVLVPLGPNHLGPPPRRARRPLSPQAKSRGRRRRTPCTGCAAAHARRYCYCRSLCTGALPPMLADAAAAALSPCTVASPARARRSCCRHNHCTGRVAGHARRRRCRRSPCTCCAPGLPPVLALVVYHFSTFGCFRQRCSDLGLPRPLDSAPDVPLTRLARFPRLSALLPR